MKHASDTPRFGHRRKPEDRTLQSVSQSASISLDIEKSPYRRSHYGDQKENERISRLDRNTSRHNSDRRLIRRRYSRSSISRITPVRVRQDLSPGSDAAFFSFISFLVSVFPYRAVALPFPVVPLILIPLPFLMLGVLPSLDGLSFHGAAFEHARTHNQPLRR